MQNRALTGRVGGAKGRARRACAPRRRCTPPGRGEDTGLDLIKQNKEKHSGF